MTAQVAQGAADEPVTCWCCGSTEAADRVVRLGDHPEVALCLACARWASSRAWEIEDRERTGTAPRARDLMRRVRQAVIDHQLHRKPVIGPFLRWLGRFVP